MPNVHRELTPENVCVLRFDRPDSSANIFDDATMTELDAHIQSLDLTIKGVVFISAKEKVFQAGADLHALQRASEAELRQFLERGQAVFNRIEALPVPTVAAIHGACLGGGYELALACRYRIASSDRATKIGLPETQLGILPAWGGSTRLPRLIGVPRALDVILAGKTPAAKHALKLGLIDEIAPREYLLPAAVRVILRGLPAQRRPRFNGLIGKLAAPRARASVPAKTRGHYPAVLKALDIVAASPSTSLAASLQHEREAVLELAQSDACRNLIRLFFLQERARKPAGGAEIKPVKRAEVIGAGVMGAGIAQWLASRGVHVVLRDVDAERVAAGLARIKKLFGERRVFTEKEARDGLDRTAPVTTDVPLEQFDLIIEAASEKMEIKKKIFAKLDGHSLLATNTSALSIAEIANATKDPGRVIGMHFFNPVHRMQLIEIIVAKTTRSDTVQRAVRFAQQIGKLPVVAQDSPGFIVNRVLMPYLMEAGLLFEAGASVTDIDEAMLEFGMPMGPLRLIDEVGVDVAADVAATLVASFADRMRVPAVLGKLLEAKWLGRKNGRGFYAYGKGKKTPVNDGVGKFQRERSAAGLSRDELARRMVQKMVDEAARCLDEKVAAGPEDIDFAMVMGTGFAPFRGGPLRYAQASGGREFYAD